MQLGHRGISLGARAGQPPQPQPRLLVAREGGRLGGGLWRGHRHRRLRHGLLATASLRSLPRVRNGRPGSLSRGNRRSDQGGLMSTTATLDPRQEALAPSFGDRLKGDPAYQGFVIMRVAFTVAPILFGLDKFFDVMVDWDVYLASWINDILPGGAS